MVIKFNKIRFYDIVIKLKIFRLKSNSRYNVQKICSFFYSVYVFCFIHYDFDSQIQQLCYIIIIIKN